MLVSEIIERSYNDWLFPAGIERPSYDVLTAGIDDVTLTIPVEGRVKNVPSDSVIEIDQEQLLLTLSVVGTLTAKQRGWLETGAASHASGAIVWIDPTYTRRSIFNALVTVIGLLYPAGIYARLVDTTTQFSFSQPTKQLPAIGKKALNIVVDIGTTYENWTRLNPGIDWEQYPETSPVRYRLYRGGKEGATMNVVYKADFTRPTAETDDLSVLAAPLPDTLQPHLPMAIAGHLMQGREIPRVQIEEIRRRLAAEGIQVGAALNVGQALLNAFMGRYVAAERDRLREADSVGLEFRR